MPTSPEKLAEAAAPPQTTSIIPTTSTTPCPPVLQYRKATITDIPSIYEIESNSYPADEAASLSSLTYRVENANEYFLVATSTPTTGPRKAEVIVGYICSTLCHKFTHESMSLHDTSATTLAIHSVCVSRDYRRQGVGSRLLTEYLNWITPAGGRVKKVVLLAKRELLGFYVSCGFEVTRVSDIVHGKDVWYHLERRVRGCRCFVVDSFADDGERGRSYRVSGNPAGVVMMKGRVGDEDRGWLEDVAKEFNHAETVFVWKRWRDGSNNGSCQCEYELRYFSRSGCEVDLCGHATLAAAAVLFWEMLASSSVDQLTCFAKRHELVVSLAGATNDNRMKIKMDFPWKHVESITDETLRDTIISILVKAFGIAISQEEEEGNLLFLGVGSDGEDLFVELSPPLFRSLPDNNIPYSLLKQCPGHTRGIIICALNDNIDDKSDFHSRFFGPKAGIDEDPVTGSAHCLLAPYFGTKLTKNQLVGRQMSERGGLVECVLREDQKRVSIIGTALKVMSAVLDV